MVVNENVKVVDSDYRLQAADYRKALRCLGISHEGKREGCEFPP